jgi:hypothetical protein
MGWFAGLEWSWKKMWLPPPQHHVSPPKTSNSVNPPPNLNYDTPVFLQNSAYTIENRNARKIGLLSRLGMIVEEIEASPTPPHLSANNI